MSKVYLGIELAASRCWGAAMDERGEVISHRRLETTRESLVDFVRSQGGERKVLMEECDMAGWVRKALLPHAEEVVVVDPVRNSWIHKDSLKNDSIDSRKLADIARLGTYFPVYHGDDPRIEELHLAVKTYEKLRGDAVRQKNRIKAKLRASGILTQGSKVFGRKGRSEAISRVESPAVREILESDYELLDYLLGKQTAAKARFLRIGREIPVVQAWMEIPGVGKVVAATFCAYVKNPHRFSKRSQLIRFSRLGITERESGGKMLARKRLDKAGNGALKDISRKAFNSAMHSREDNRFKRAYDRTLKNTGDPVHARLSTQRKILTVMWTMWKDGTAYDDGNHPIKRA